MKNIAIIGAGITGLSAAFYAKKAGNSVKVFEKMSRVGGVMHTLQKNGFTYETGPSTLRRLGNSGPSRTGFKHCREALYFEKRQALRTAIGTYQRSRDSALLLEGQVRNAV